MNFKKNNICKMLFVCAFTVLVFSGVPSGEKYGASLEDEKKKQQEMQNELKDTQKLLNKLENL